MPSYTKTIVFTDLAGYTQKTATISREELQLLAEKHESHVRGLFTPYGGKLVKNIGDSYMVVFESATDAIKGCLELVQTTLPDTDMQFRASAATGDVQELQNEYFKTPDYFGEAVNLAARINSMTPAGEVWFANRTRVCMTQSEVAWESLGLRSFKGVPGKEECFRAVTPKQAFIPKELEADIKDQQYSVITPNKPISQQAVYKRVIFLVGFAMASPELEAALNLLSSVVPSQIWFVNYTLTSSARYDLDEKGYRLLVAQPDAFEQSLQRTVIQLQQEPDEQTNSFALDFSTLGDISVELIGVALPTVPLVNLINSYSIDLLPDGTWGYNKSQAIAEIHVEAKGVSIKAFRPGMMVNAVGIPMGEVVALKQNSMFRIHDWSFRYLTNVGAIYKGIILGAGTLARQYNVGDDVEIGRAPNGIGFELEDRGGTDRIQWLSGPQTAKAIEQQLTLDRTLTGRQHTKLKITRKDLAVLSPLHARLPTFVIPKGRSTLEKVGKDQAFNIGDILVVGTNVLHLSKMF